MVTCDDEDDDENDFGVDEYDEMVDIWDYSGCSDVEEEDDGLLHDPDFADSGFRMSQKSAQFKLQHSEPCDEQKKNRCSTFHLPHLQGPKRERKRLSFVSGKSIKP